MPLAIFDLDNTLLSGDSDHAWGVFLAENNVVDAVEYKRQHDHFLQEYRAGKLDIDAFLEFQLRPFKQNDEAKLLRLRAKFMQEKVHPMITDNARALVNEHRQRGHILMIITATNRFITRPIADEFGIDQLIATDLEVLDNRYSGRVDGVPSFREGKVTRLKDWLEQNNEDLGESWFYSDSHNDLPLLRLVENAVAVNPDPELRVEALANGWKILELV